MPAELSIIIVNWNGGELLRKCLLSILANPPAISYQIILVDNASTDGSVAAVRGDEKIRQLISADQLRIVENAGNRGFGAANNQAFALCHTPFLFLLNPDTEVTAGAIDKLIASVSSEARVGASGPRILNADGSLQVSVWRNPPAAWEILLSQMKLYLLLPARMRGELLLGGHWQHDRRRVVPMLSGAAILVKREVIDQVGGFDERFHMYGEDNEWCFRVSRAGWQLVFEPAALILHHGASSSSQRWTNLEKVRVQMEASFEFQKQALGPVALVTNQLANYFVTVLQHSWRQIRRVPAPELQLARGIHWQHLKQSFISRKNFRVSSGQNFKSS